jgi:hypothetical protein
LPSSPYDFNHRDGKTSPHTRRESDKNYSTRFLHVSVDQLTKILVFGNQDAVASNRSFHDVLIFFARRHFSDCNDIVICGTKSAHDRKIAALVGEKAHRLSACSRFRRRHDQSFLVSQGIGCVAYGRMDILAREAGVGIKQIILSRAFAELPEDQLDRNTGPADDGFSQHYFWIDFYTIRNCHGKFLKSLSLFWHSRWHYVKLPPIQQDFRSVPLPTPTVHEHVFSPETADVKGALAHLQHC